MKRVHQKEKKSMTNKYVIGEKKKISFFFLVVNFFNEILDHLDLNMHEKKVHIHNQLIDEENQYLDKQLDDDVLKI